MSTPSDPPEEPAEPAPPAPADGYIVPGAEPVPSDDHAVAEDPGTPPSAGFPPPVPPAPYPSPVPPAMYPAAPLGPAQGATPRKRPSLGAGVGIGFAALFVGVLLLLFGSPVLGWLYDLGWDVGIWGFLWPFILIVIVGVVLMFSQKWRRFATGYLIVAAAFWLIVLGPCIALLSGF